MSELQIPTKQIFSCRALVTDGSDRFLAVRRAPGFSQAGVWEFIGGGIDRGETASDALVREAKEEAGLDLSIVGNTPQEFERRTIPDGKHAGSEIISVGCIALADCTDIRLSPEHTDVYLGSLATMYYEMDITPTTVMAIEQLGRAYSLT